MMNRLGHERVSMKRLLKRGQTGQAIIVLALGFIALLGFVGIVTDVSLLFVRYSSLSRAVDAAAVAAAGQMRRVADDTANGVVGEAASAATLSLAARQFIEIYGIDPTTVLVETCRMQRFRSAAGDPADRDNEPLYLSDGSVNPAANDEDLKSYEQLCTNEELKLVRVTAQIDAPTTFMSILGYPTITLTVSAVSQTAVLDVVLIMDVSESMLAETTYRDWEEPLWTDGSGNQHGYGMRYLPPRVSNIHATHSIIGTTGNLYDEEDAAWDWRNIVTRTQANIMQVGIPNWPEGNDTADAHFYNPLSWLPSDTVVADQRQPPNDLCRVRIAPQSEYGRNPMPRSMWSEYIQSPTNPSAPFADEAAFRTFYQLGGGANAAAFYVGYVPQYNYFGCCNDPNGDFDFGDLVCQPFRQARDAAEGFLARLDFLRGDRVAFVTFDRQAYVIDPDGAGSQIPFIETQNNLHANPADTNSALVRRGAEETLTQVVGVRSEPNFYTSDGNGNWNGIKIGNVGYTQQELHDSIAIGNLPQQPTLNTCPLDYVQARPNLAMPSERYYWDAANSRIIARSNDDGARDTPLDDVTTGGPGGARNQTMPNWIFSLDSTAWQVNLLRRERNFSYEYVASCAGTNIGGALGEASQTLFVHGRREGAVWLMVLLSDGAAGASNPVTRYGTGNLATAPVFSRETRTGTLIDPSNPLNNTTVSFPVVQAIPGEYGAYGLCPYGTPGQPGEILRDTVFPYCSDTLPHTRTFCGDDTVANPPFNVVMGNPSYPECEQFYDVDDYARDWADWVGLANLNGASSSGRVADQLLPTIFTIGFGLNYNVVFDSAGNPSTDNSVCANDNYDCVRGLSPYNSDYNQDYLGEELLRYIADVGDNFRVDSDYWQVQMGARIGNGTNPVTAEYGPRGACEIPEGALGGAGRDQHSPLPPRTSCGNYFAAATEEELNRVFNEIASKMFTRISQ